MRTEAEQRLLETEVGLQVIERLTSQPVPADQATRFYWPRCPHCRRRPTFYEMKGSWLRFKTGVDEPKFIDISRYGILPCCSAKYMVEVTWATRKEKLRAASN